MSGTSAVRLIAVVVLGVGSVALPQPAWSQTPAAGDKPVTFTKDVAPIFQEKCEVCHRPGNIGPMSLITYEEIRPWVRSIKTRVASRDMPPWHVDKGVGIQKFINDRSLTDAQIDTIVRWVDAGAPRGDAKDMPAPKQWPSGDRFELEAVLGPPDLVIRAKPFTMPAKSPDVHVDVEMPVSLSEPRWVRASETKPSLKGRRIAHHADAFLIRPNTPEAFAAERAARASQPGAESALDQRGRMTASGDRQEYFTEWAQGKGGEVYPENAGKLVMPGTNAAFRIHYHAVGEEITDTVEMAWWFHPKGKTPKYSLDYMAMGRVLPQELQIPPHTVTEHQAVTVLKAPAILHNFQPHMHYRGKSQTLEAIYPDGRREVVNQASRFSNNWHINYIYDPDHAPVFPKGTVLIVTSVHDNTTANKNNPDPRQWVAGGSRTVDEMAHLNQQVIYITDEDYNRLVEERRKRASTQN
jgi:hypothetical protein